MKEKVAVAISGGVDSSVSAYLLKEKGYDVVGVTLLLHSECGKKDAKSCCSFEDVLTAKEVLDKLKIEHFILNKQDLFSEKVKKYYVDELKKGKTPSPCIFCNKYLKFDFLSKWAGERGISKIATGHYARLFYDGEKISLLRGRDRNKDQSYFLFNVDERILERTIFPLGDLLKKDVRNLASELKLPTSEKRESQDLCFGKGETFKEFLRMEGVEDKEGDIVLDGKVVGKHNGISHFTVGQRRGIRIPYSEPLYVIKIDKRSNRIFIGMKQNLEKKRFKVDEWNFKKGEERETFELQVRYRQKAKMARLIKDEKGTFIEWLNETEVSAPGQAAVAYFGDKVIGGGFVGEDC
jgi:tRNA-specific 2-thiouridylase